MELHRLRNLEGGEVLSGVFDQLLARRPHILLENDDGVDSLAPAVTRNADDGYLLDRRMGGDDVLHFSGVHVFSPGDDHVLHPVGQVQEPPFIEVAHIAGAIPPVAHHLFGLVGLAPVAAHEVAATGADLSRLPPWLLLAQRIGDTKLDPEHGRAGRSEHGPVGPVLLGTEERQYRRRFGHAVSLVEVDTGEHRQPSPQHRLGDRGGPVDKLVQRAQTASGEGRVLFEHGHHDRYHHRGVDLLPFDRIEHQLRIEQRNRHRCGPAGRDAQDRGHDSRVEHR